MPVLLFRLNGVPADEAHEVRTLLDANHIEYYETDAGRWGISLAALWLPDDSQLATARQLIDAYQLQRSAQARAAYAEQARHGQQETLWQRLRTQPAPLLLYLLAILVILYLTLMPFVRFLQ